VARQTAKRGDSVIKSVQPAYRVLRETGYVTHVFLQRNPHPSNKRPGSRHVGSVAPDPDHSR
jgi:hypothetical protein